jgi:hypothetical protein
VQLELTTDAVTRVMEAVGLLLSHFDHGTKHQGDEVRSVFQCLAAHTCAVSELCCGRFLPVDWR